MRIGFNTVSLHRHLGGREVFYLNVLHTIRRVQPDVTPVIFTTDETDGLFGDFECVAVESGLDIASAAKAADAAVLLSPFEAALEHSPIPQCVLVMALPRGETGAGRRGLFRGRAGRTSTKLLARAPSIIAPSDFVKRELLERYDVAMEKVVVAPLGVDSVFEEEQSPFVAPPYLLSVGSTVDRRNVNALMKAYRSVAPEHKVSLVVVGRAGEAEPDDWGAGVMRIEHIPGRQLAALYQHASLAVFPSAYEGSGVSVLEAMRAGTVVVTGRVGGVPEVAHNAPIYFNPESNANLVAAVRRGLEERPTQRRERIAAGRKQARAYTWEDCTWKTLGALKRANLEARRKEAK